MKRRRTVDCVVIEHLQLIAQTEVVEETEEWLESLPSIEGWSRSARPAAW